MIVDKLISKSWFGIVLIVISTLLFVPFLGNVHLFDWDEINFAENAREMLLTGDYFRVMINFEPFGEKPPFFIWLQVLSMKIFGINEYAARFPNAIVGIITLFFLFRIGKAEQGQRFGFWWMLLYMGSFLPHLYFKSGIIDPTFNLFIFLGIYFLSKTDAETTSSQRIKNIVLAGVFIGLGILTKGPVSLLVAILSFVIYSIWQRKLNVFKFSEMVFFAISAFVITFAWFGVETIKNGPWFILAFIQRQIELFSTQDAGHGGPFFYHFVVLLIGCFPASIFFIGSQKKYFFKNASSMTKWMLILFWVVLILFSIVETKIVHYSSLCYFPLTYLAALFVKDFSEKNIEVKLYQKILYYLIGGVLSLALFLFPLLVTNKDSLIPYIKDQFAVANLQAETHWSFVAFLPGILLFIALVMSGYFYKKQKQEFGILSICLGVILALQIAMLTIVPNIEAISQNASIDFLSKLKGKDCYVTVLGYKSYAHYFYAQKQPGERKEALDNNWLLWGEIDKPVYFVSKIDRNKIYDEMPQLKKLGQKNGFVFYLREPVLP